MRFLTVSDVMSITGLGRTKAYEMIRTMNAELKNMGYITMRGKVPEGFFQSKFYGGSQA